MSEIENNPGRYRELCEPFRDSDEANASLNAFFEDVKASRVRHGLPDIFVAVEVRVIHANPEIGETRAIANLYMGDAMGNKLPMLARLYGEARAEHESQMGALIAAGREQHARRGRG